MDQPLTNVKTTIPLSTDYIRVISTEQPDGRFYRDQMVILIKIGEGRTISSRPVVHQASIKGIIRLESELLIVCAANL
jgi:hypothetical protein